MSNSIPDRWLSYKPFGTVIKGTKILPFKVPLNEGTCWNNLVSDERFTPTKLMEEFPNLKFIIDLTNTNRYYNEKEFTDSGITYKKIMFPGRQIPSMEIIRTFFKTMDDFTSACGEGDVIGVHCTHGINRTGYLICRYLMQQLGWALQDCLKAFEEARGHAIDRDIYLKALKYPPHDEKTKMSGKAPSRQSLRRSQYARTIHDPYAYPPQRFGFGGPPRDSRPISRMPPPGMPPIPPPGMSPGPPPHMYRPRPFAYGPPPRPAFLVPGFPACMPGPSTISGINRLPPGPPVRLPPPKMLPPPPPRPVRTDALKSLEMRKRKYNSRNNIDRVPKNPTMKRRNQMKLLPKIRKEQDFTIDTFDENLLAMSSQQHRRITKGRFNQTK